MRKVQSFWGERRGWSLDWYLAGGGALRRGGRRSLPHRGFPLGGKGFVRRRGGSALRRASGGTARGRLRLGRDGPGRRAAAGGNLEHGAGAQRLGRADVVCRLEGGDRHFVLGGDQGQRLPGLHLVPEV